MGVSIPFRRHGVVTGAFRDWEHGSRLGPRTYVCRPSTGIMALITTLLSSCTHAGGGLRDKVSLTSDSAGAVVTVIALDDKPAPWQVRSGRVLMPTDDGPSLLIEHRHRVGADWTGNVFVVNSLKNKVDVFDSSGRRLRSLGRRGSGPGEFKYPEHIWVATDGSVSVVDLGKRTIVRFGPSGEVLPEQAFLIRGYPLGGIRIDGDTIVADEAEYSSGPARILRWIAANDTVELARIVNPTRDSAEFRCGKRSVVLFQTARVLDPEIRWAKQGDQIAVSTQAEYEVKWFERGILAGVARRGLPHRPASIAAVEALYPAGIVVGQSCRATAGDLVRQLGMATSLPLIAGVSIAPDGSTWIERFVLPGERQKIDVLDQGLHYVGTVDGVGLPVGYFNGGWFVAPVNDTVSGGILLRTYQLDPPPW